MIINKIIRKCLSLICLCFAFILCFSGCDRLEESQKPEERDFEVLLQIPSKHDSDLHRYVFPWKTKEITEESLGDIITEGDYYEVNPDNILCYMGAYKGLDYVTLVFDSNSPIGLKNIEMCLEQHENYSGSLDGILYQEKDGRKYVMLKYETLILKYPDGSVKQYDQTKDTFYIKFPAKRGESMLFYSILLEPWKSDYEAIVHIYIEKEDYPEYYYSVYDVVSQHYDKETNSWTEEFTKDYEYDYMPLE